MEELETVNCWPITAPLLTTKLSPTLKLPFAWTAPERVVVPDTVRFPFKSVFWVTLKFSFTNAWPWAHNVLDFNVPIDAVPGTLRTPPTEVLPAIWTDDANEAVPLTSRLPRDVVPITLNVPAQTSPLACTLPFTSNCLVVVIPLLLLSIASPETSILPVNKLFPEILISLLKNAWPSTHNVPPTEAFPPINVLPEILTFSEKLAFPATLKMSWRFVTPPTANWSSTLTLPFAWTWPERYVDPLTIKPPLIFAVPDTVRFLLKSASPETVTVPLRFVFPPTDRLPDTCKDPLISVSPLGPSILNTGVG